MFFSISKIAALLFSVVCLAGCMSFDYVGQSFAPLNESRPVNLINGRSNFSSEQYRIIGRGVLTGPKSTDLYDRQAKLRSEARARGADAVCIVSSRVKAVGFYPRSSGSFAPPASASSNVDNIDSTGKTWTSDSFGQEQTLKGEKKARYEFETKVLFLKRTDDFNAEMKKRSSFL